MPTFSAGFGTSFSAAAPPVFVTPGLTDPTATVPLPSPITSPTASVTGFALVPHKLVNRIMRGEYVEMRELLPYAWHSTHDDQSSCCRASRPKRGGLVMDILLCTEGFVHWRPSCPQNTPTKPQIHGLPEDCHPCH